MRGRVIGVSLLGVAAACSHYEGVDPTTDGGVSDGGVVEAGSGAADAGSFWVSSGTAGWCKGLSPQPTKCWDFDEQSDLTGQPVQTDQGTVALDSVATSPPSALYSQITPKQNGHAMLEVPYATSPTRVRLQSDVRFETPQDYVEFDTLHFEYDNGNSECSLEPAISDGQLLVNEYCSGAIGDLSIAHVVGALAADIGWYTFALEVDFGARTLNAFVKKPDGTVEGFPRPVTIDAKVVSGTAELFIGVGYSTAYDPPTRLRLDNVGLDYE